MHIESDRIGIRRGSNHLYAYAKSNPLSYSDKLGTIPNFGGGAFGVAGILAGGFSVEYEECCKGKTKYARTLVKIMYGLGVGLDGQIASGGGSNGVQIFGPTNECQDYRFDRPERIFCLTASYYLGVDACQNDGNRSLMPDTMNGNIGLGAAAYTVRVRTYIWKEVPSGCCSR